MLAIIPTTLPERYRRVWRVFRDAERSRSRALRRGGRQRVAAGCGGGCHCSSGMACCTSSSGRWFKPLGTASRMAVHRMRPAWRRSSRPVSVNKVC